MRKLILLITIFSISQSLLHAQEKSPAGHYIVEFDKVSPPTKDIITHLEGSEAQNFMAPDTEGNQQALHKYKGQNILLVFWDTDYPQASSLIDMMNDYQSTHNTVKVLAFCNQSTKVAKAFLADQSVKYPVLGHGSFIGEAHYYPVLGNPRMFMIGQDGVIKHVIPSEMITDASAARGYLDELSKVAFSN